LTYFVKTLLMKKNKDYVQTDEESSKYLSTRLIETEKVLTEVAGGKPTSIRKVAENTFNITVNNLKAKEKLIKTNSITLNNTEYALKSEDNTRLSQVRGTVRAKSLLLETDEELLEYLKEQKVIKIERMKKLEKGVLTETGTFILTFDKPILPAKVSIAWETLNVRQFYDRPMQCKVCYEFGHTKKRCINNQRCVQCGKTNHKASECNNIICVNCKQGHTATSRECYHYQRETAIIKAATDLKITFKEARQQLNDFEKSHNSGYASSVKEKSSESVTQVRSEKPKNIENSSQSRLKTAQVITKQDCENIEKKKNETNNTKETKPKETTTTTTTTQDKITNYLKQTNKSNYKVTKTATNIKVKRVKLLKMYKKDKRVNLKGLLFKDKNGVIFNAEGDNIQIINETEPVEAVNINEEMECSDESGEDSNENE
jgi:hypothetical protein